MKKRAPSHPSVSLGGVVIVHNDTLPRGPWKLGQVQKVLTGCDGQPRAAVVRVASRDCQHVILKRLLQLLYPLEICEAGTPVTDTEDVAPDTHVSTPIEECDDPTQGTPERPERRPVRAAAKRANEQLTAWMDPRTTSLRINQGELYVTVNIVE